MNKRKTQWLKGFELFDPRINPIDKEILIVESLLDGSLPEEIKSFFKRYQPINIYDDTTFVDTINTESMGMVFSGELYKEKNIVTDRFYDIDEIIYIMNKYKCSSLGLIHRQLKVLPIAGCGSPYGDIVACIFGPNAGKIYILIDYQESPVDNTTLIALNIYELINGMEILPWDEMLIKVYGTPQ